MWASRTRPKKFCAAVKSFLTVFGMFVWLIRLASCFNVPLSQNEPVLYKRFHITYIYICICIDTTWELTDALTNTYNLYQINALYDIRCNVRVCIYIYLYIPDRSKHTRACQSSTFGIVPSRRPWGSLDCSLASRAPQALSLVSWSPPKKWEQTGHYYCEARTSECASWYWSCRVQLVLIWRTHQVEPVYNGHTNHACMQILHIAFYKQMLGM